MGMAAAFRNNLVMKSAARVQLDGKGGVVVETDMTDIGTGSYTIIAQTAAEMLGVGLDKVFKMRQTFCAALVFEAWYIGRHPQCADSVPPR